MVYVDDENDASPFGRGFTRTISEATQQKVDSEIRRVLDEQYGLARRLLEENRDKVEAMTAALMEWETIDADQINDIMEGRPRALLEEPPARRRFVGWWQQRRGEARQRAGACFAGGIISALAPFTGWCGFTPARFAFIHASCSCPIPLFPFIPAPLRCAERRSNARS